MKRTLIALFLLCLLSACGNKAALMLPDKKPAPAADQPTPAKDAGTPAHKP